MLFALAAPASMTQGSSLAGVRSPDPAVPAILGQSVVALTGPWKFHIGDDPRWADPKFDDSNWEQYDLAPGSENLAPERALRFEELPGWQHHGHPGYAGYGWYRIQLKIQPGASPLALLMPFYVDDAYEVYLNGYPIGRFGKLDGFQLTYSSQPQFFPIPAGVARIGQPNTLAIRFWNMRWEARPGGSNMHGGLRSVPLLGSSALAQIFYRSLSTQPPHELLTELGLYTVVGLISIFLFLFSRGQREYLWAGIGMIGRALLLAAIAVQIAQQTRIPFQLTYAAQFVGICVAYPSMPLAAMYLLAVPRKAWKRANYVVVFLYAAYGVVATGSILGLLPSSSAVERLHAGLTGISGAFLVGLLLLIAIDGIRTIGRKAWLLMTPGLLFGCHGLLYYSVVDKPGFAVFELLAISVPVSVVIIFLLRFTEQQRDNSRLLEDMRQAQEVQSLLIPRELPNLPGWLIESAYRPAREVGGDFFQVLLGEDGSLLIVVGDVSGKGLKAAMTVSAIVGALRNDETRRPAQVLTHLNRILSGQVVGFVTCSATRITEDGAMTIANAGHLPPYRNGEEMPAPSGFPLGIVAEASYEEERFKLAPGDRLTFVSDGVAEARNSKGELLGFQRAAALTQKGAAEIADAAERWGQEDDITVLTVARAPKLEVVTA